MKPPVGFDCPSGRTGSFFNLFSTENKALPQNFNFTHSLLNKWRPKRSKVTYLWSTRLKPTAFILRVLCYDTSGVMKSAVSTACQSGMQPRLKHHERIRLAGFPWGGGNVESIRGAFQCNAAFFSFHAVTQKICCSASAVENSLVAN